MKRFIFASFIAFLASVATIALLARLVPAPSADASVSVSELARHASERDCWLAIEGGVYDVTAYVPAHPAPPSALLDWCGRDATAAFGDKGSGSPHSPQARELLETMRVGTLR